MRLKDWQKIHTRHNRKDIMTEGNTTGAKKQLSKADYKHMYEEEKAKVDGFENQATLEVGAATNRIQWMEKDGIFKLLERKAKEQGRTVNEWAKAIVRATVGIK